MSRARERDCETRHERLRRSFHYGLDNFSGAPGVEKELKTSLEEREKNVLEEGRLTREPECEESVDKDARGSAGGTEHGPHIW
jgi:hypothetical protein